MKDKNSLRTLIAAQNSGRSEPAINIVKNNPLIASVVSKLHQPDDKINFNQYGNRKISNPNHSNIIGISRDVYQKTTDNENVMELFPELRLAGEILISSIIAPKDMNSTELNYSIPSNLKVFPISQQILPLIEEYLTKDYKIEQMVPDMLKRVLLYDGCYPIIVIPENSVDDLINGRADISMENMKTHMDSHGVFKATGILGNNDTNKNTKESNFSLEDFLSHNGYQQSHYDPVLSFKDKNKTVRIDNVIITDNFSALKLPKIIETRRKNSITNILDKNRYSTINEYSAEGVSQLTDRQLTQLLYKNKQAKSVMLRKVKTDNELIRETVGAPLIIKLPPEAVIPIYQPGDYENHVGYFILLDAEGNPLNYKDSMSGYDDMKFRQALETDMNSSLVQRTADMFGTNCADVTFDNMSKVYADIIEADLMARLKNGIIGDNISIAKPEEISRIMLARMLAKQRTQLLFVPSELLTYFAIDFRKNGTGKSLLDGMMILNALRATTMFANVQRGIINSVGRTEAEINIDEKDPQPRKTLEIAMHEVLKTKQSQTMPATISPIDIMTYIASSSIQFKLGQIPGLPSTNINFNEVATSYQTPDTDLEENLKERQIMALGIPVEMVDNAKGVDFATTATNNNLLLSKRVMQYQDKFAPLITDNARKVIINHGGIMKNIKEVIKKNLGKLTDIVEKDEFFEHYKDNPDILVKLLAIELVSNFEITLSRPDVISIDVLVEAYNARSEAVDKALEAYFTSDILASAYTGEAAGERIDEIKAMLKAQLMRTWMKENNMLPEVGDMVSLDEDGNYVYNVVESQQQHVNAATKLVRDLLAKTVPVGQAATRDIEKISGDEELADSTVSSDSGSDYGSDDDSSDDSSDDMDMDSGDDSSDDDLDAGLEMPGMDDF